MTTRKRRLTVTVDPDLVEAASRAVSSGSADSLSAWVNAALTDRARRDEQLARLGDSIADYEAEFGEITIEEITRQRRADAQHALVVRGTVVRGTVVRGTVVRGTVVRGTVVRGTVVRGTPKRTAKAKTA